MTLWCKSERSNPPTDIVWFDSGISIPKSLITTTSEEAADGGAVVHSQVVRTFDKARYWRVVMCLPVYNGVPLEHLALNFSLHTASR